MELPVLVESPWPCAALRPFGSYATPGAERLARWALFLPAGYIFFRPVIAAGSALAGQTRLPRSVAIAAACLFGALPTSLVVALAFAGFRWRQVTIGELAAIYPQVLIVGATVTVIQLLAQRTDAPAAGPRTNAVRSDRRDAGVRRPASWPERGGREPASVRRSSAAAPWKRGDLPRERGPLCQGPYPVGSAMILMRMRDAVAQLVGKGERVHRSWWVAREAVVAVVRQDRTVKLKLSDGRTVPVARSTVAALRDKELAAELPAEL